MIKVFIFIQKNQYNLSQNRGKVVFWTYLRNQKSTKRGARNWKLTKFFGLPVRILVEQIFSEITKFYFFVSFIASQYIFPFCLKEKWLSFFYSCVQKIRWFFIQTSRGLWINIIIFLLVDGIIFEICVKFHVCTFNSYWDTPLFLHLKKCIRRFCWTKSLH